MISAGVSSSAPNVETPMLTVTAPVGCALPVRELRALDAAADALGDDARLGEPGLRQQDAELLAAVARGHVGRAQRRLQTLRRHLQREVARLVAVAVVVRLEVVDVHHHEAHREAVSLRALQLLLQDALRGSGG